MEWDIIAARMAQISDVGGQVESLLDECGDKVHRGVLGEEELLLGALVLEIDALLHQ